MNVRQVGLEGLRLSAQMRFADRVDIERLALWPLLVALLIHLAIFLPLPLPSADRAASSPPPAALDVDVVEDKAPASQDKVEKNQVPPAPAAPNPPVRDAVPAPPPAPAGEPPVAEKGAPPPDQFPAASDKPAQTKEAEAQTAPDALPREAPKADLSPNVQPAPPPPLLESPTGDAPVVPPPLPAKPENPSATPPRPVSPAKPVAPKPAPAKVEPRDTAKPPSREQAEKPREPQISTVPAPTPSPQPPAHALNDEQASIGYIRQVAAFLNRVKTYPEKARAAGQQGIVVVRFTISRAGQVGSINVLRSSGSEALDDAGLALVRRAAPFPPLPDDFNGPLLTLTLPLSFGLR